MKFGIFVGFASGDIWQWKGLKKDKIKSFVAQIHVKKRREEKLRGKKISFRSLIFSRHGCGETYFPPLVTKSLVMTDVIYSLD